MESALKTFRYYYTHVRRHLVLLILASVAIPSAVVASSYLPPLVLAGVLNKLATHAYRAHHVWPAFAPAVLEYAGISILGILFWRLADIALWNLEAYVEEEIAQQVFGHLIDQSADFHANQFSGSLVSQTSKILGSYIRISDTTCFQVVPLFTGLVFSTILMAHRSPLYAVALAGISLLYIVSSFFITKTVRALSAHQALAESQQTGTLADALTNIMAIKSFAHDSYERARFRRATARTHRRLKRVIAASQRQQAVFGIITTSMSAVSFLIAIIGVVSFGSNLATMFLIFSYTSSIVSQIFTFSNNSLRNYNRAIGDAADMLAILDQKPNITDPINPEPARMTNGNLDFSHVSFQHNGANEKLLDDFNLEVPEGQKVGLVGHSGSGKTTLTRLILRFSDIQSGSITIDGQDITRVTQHDLRSAIAYVPQEPLLFHRTIRENIAYGSMNASDEAVVTAAERAHASEFIDVLPHGYDTLVGERGVKLSGGQRQRIAIARAMLRTAPILLLDEATSALDSVSEGYIQDALWKLMEGRTAIVIAHRLSTIQKMDRIIVLSDGKIVEDGSHQELLAQNGTYAGLWSHQTGGFIEE